MPESEIKHKANATHQTEEKHNRIGILKKISFKKLTIYLASMFIIVIAVLKINETKNQQIKQPLDIRVFALGRVQPTEYIRSIQYPMIYSSSRIKHLYVKENQFIKKGDPLFSVEDRDESIYNMKSSKAKIIQQIAELESSRAKMLSSKTLRDFYRGQHKRYNFLRNQGAATYEQADEKETLYRAAEQEYLSNQKLVETNKAKLKSAEWDYESNRFKTMLSVIKAPENGKVFKIYTRQGESINNGKAVMDVGNSNSMGILAEVNRADIKNIKLGQAANITANGVPEIKWRGRVIEVSGQVTHQTVNSDDPAANLANRVFNVLIKLDKKSSLQAQNYNYMEVNILFEPNYSEK